MRAMGDIRQLIGLVEEEGSFYWTGNRKGQLGSLCIKISTTDKDVAQWAARLFGRPVQGPHKPSGLGTKNQYHAYVTGPEAAGWMMTMFSFLGKRRRAKIRQLLHTWRTRKGSDATSGGVASHHAGRVHTARRRL